MLSEIELKILENRIEMETAFGNNRVQVSFSELRELISEVRAAREAEKAKGKDKTEVKA